MSHTLAPADASHYYQRLAELSTMAFWQRAEFTDRPIHDAFGLFQAEEEV